MVCISGTQSTAAILIKINTWDNKLLHINNKFHLSFSEKVGHVKIIVIYKNKKQINNETLTETLMYKANVIQKLIVRSL